MQDILSQALSAMLKEADHMTCHAARLAHASFQAGSEPGMLKRENNGYGVAVAERHGSASLGRLHRHAGNQPQGLTCSGRKDFSGIELAKEFVRIVNVQHNFDANTKAVSTIDTMTDSILSMQV